MAVSTLMSTLAGLKDEKRQLETAITAILTAKRKAGPEPPVTVN